VCRLCDPRPPRQPLYRYNPLLKKEGKNPLQLDSPAPTVPLSELLSKEVRFASLIQAKPEVARRLHAELQADLDERNSTLREMAAKSYAAAAPSPAVPAAASPAPAAH